MEEYIKLKNMYIKFLNLSKQLTITIDDNDFNEITNIINAKDILLEKIKNQKQKVEKKYLKTQEFIDLFSELKKNEINNIKTIENMKSEISNKLESLSNNKKVLNAYNTLSDQNRSGKILDFKE